MASSSIRAHFEEAKAVLDLFLSNDENLLAIENAGTLMVKSLQNGGKIISCGNGGSMCDAMHFAEELSGRYRENRKALAAIAISDPGHLSCVSNDFGYNAVFSRYLEAMGKPGDVLLAISTSGNSENIIQAVNTAKSLGMITILLSGKDGGKLKGQTDQEIIVPHFGYADRIQEIHIKVIHALIDYIEQHLA